MKLRKLAAAAGIAAGTAAIGMGAAAEMLFKKTVDIGNDRGMPKLNIGFDWHIYIPLVKEKIEWISSMEPEEHYILTDDKLKLKAKYIKAEKPTHKTVIAVHGYRSRSIYEFSAIAEMYHKNGYNVLLVDCRSHGESEGRYAGLGALDRYDILQWIHYVVSTIDRQAEIWLHGISTGASTILFVSEFRLPDNVKGVIADCAFTSSWEVLNHIFGNKYGVNMRPVLKLTSLICKRRVGYRFEDINTVEILKNSTLPMLFIHGSEDNFVPVAMSRRNYEACASDKKELLIMDGACHAESFYKNPELYEKAVMEFING
ncbi:MAG: alpha/beta hydrolase [Candidatus Ornithomonoglobus sp.]